MKKLFIIFLFLQFLHVIGGSQVVMDKKNLWKIGFSINSYPNNQTFLMESKIINTVKEDIYYYAIDNLNGTYKVVRTRRVIYEDQLLYLQK